MKTELQVLKESIETIQKRIEELEQAEKVPFKPCSKGYYIDHTGEIGDYYSPQPTIPNIVQRARLFETTEIARKVDDIISPSYFIAQYVFKHCPDFKTDFNNFQRNYCLIEENEKYVVTYDNFEHFGVVYMPHNIADDLCKLLNNGDYQLGVSDE